MSKTKMLLVDDRRVDRLLYKELLHDLGFEFIELDNGEEIVSTVKENNIDLVLLDWQMPRVNGFESLKQLKQHDVNDEVPVIVVTGLKDEKVMKDAFQFGSVDFIQKPIEKLEIVSRVESALKLSKASKELRKRGNELRELNLLISAQRDELKETLKVREELAALKQKQLKDTLNQHKRKIVELEMESSQKIKNVDGLLSITNELKELIKQGRARKTSLNHVKVLEDAINELNPADDNWLEFKRVFDMTYPGFFKELAKLPTKLTSLDLKHCAYIKMNMESSELAEIMGVEQKSIQMTRYRLKKKLKLSAKDSLNDFLMLL